MPKITNEEWLKQKLTELTKLAEGITREEPTTDYHDFTALKLIAIHYYATIFAKIVQSQKRKNNFDGAVYVDLFAGTGLVKLKGSKFNDYLPGSPICAAILKPHKFDYIVCVESNKKRCMVLKKRLLKILPEEKFSVIQGDCNKNISKVIQLINEKFKNPILLTFVDPEGLEIKFSTLKTLSLHFQKCDFMVNVNSQGVKRVSAKVEKGISNVRGSLEEYYDKDAKRILYDLEAGMQPEDQYAEVIKTVLGKTIGSTIKIRGEGNKIEYYLLGYTRMTQGGSQYRKGFKVLADRLDGIDKKKVRREIEKIHNRQSELDSFS